MHWVRWVLLHVNKYVDSNIDMDPSVSAKWKVICLWKTHTLEKKKNLIGWAIVARRTHIIHSLHFTSFIAIHSVAPPIRQLYGNSAFINQILGGVLVQRTRLPALLCSSKYLSQSVRARSCAGLIFFFQIFYIDASTLDNYIGSREFRSDQSNKQSQAWDGTNSRLNIMPTHLNILHLIFMKK